MTANEIQFHNYSSDEETNQMNCDYVKCDVTHSDFALRIPEVKIKLLSTIWEIKEKLTAKLGTMACDMELVLQNHSGDDVSDLNENDDKFELYNPDNGYVIHVIDTNPNSITKQLGNVNDVQKYVMSDAEYKKRPVTVKKHFKQLRKDHPELFSVQGMQFKVNPDYMKEEAEAIEVGSRVKLINIDLANFNSKVCDLYNGLTGTVRYVGQVHKIYVGYCLGVELDLPKGYSNGSIKGVPYFNCGDKKAVFLRPFQVEVGDFKVGSDEEDIDEI